jgi:hypothetical protein
VNAAGGGKVRADPPAKPRDATSSFWPVCLGDSTPEILLADLD